MNRSSFCFVPVTPSSSSTSSSSDGCHHHARVRAMTGRPQLCRAHSARSVGCRFRGPCNPRTDQLVVAALAPAHSRCHGHGHGNCNGHGHGHGHGHGNCSGHGHGNCHVRGHGHGVGRVYVHGPGPCHAHGLVHEPEHCHGHGRERVDHPENCDGHRHGHGHGHSQGNCKGSAQVQAATTAGASASSSSSSESASASESSSGSSSSSEPEPASSSPSKAPAQTNISMISTTETAWADLKPNEAEVLNCAPKGGKGGLRIGHGYDLHRLEPGYPLILGGIKLDHDRGCCGHSDGDAVLHCVTDAVLGALSLPDIGQLFSDKDPRWKGAPSDVFLREAYKRMTELGYEVSNIDVTIILEKPKLAPIKGEIRKNIAELLRCDLHSVNVKAKTHEKVDAVGENRAVEVHAVAILRPNPTSGSNSETKNQVTLSSPGTLDRLYDTVRSRKGADPETSWTAKLFAKGRGKIAQKVGEEATEVVIDAIKDNKEGVVKESADILYHMSVLWADMGITPEDVYAELERREGTSGIAEKQSRSEQ